MNEQSNRVYGDPEKYITTESRPQLSEEEKRKAAARARIAARQQRLEEKTDDYINLINQNHGIKGKHAGALKPTRIDANAEREYQEDIRYIARKQHDQRMREYEQRIKENKEIQKHTRNLKIKEHAPQILAAALVVSATMAGIVGAVLNEKTVELQDSPAMEQLQEAVNEQTLKQSYQEAGIVPTQAEYEAGLTADQIIAKRAMDEQANAEIMENLGLDQQTQGKSL